MLEFLDILLISVAIFIVLVFAINVLIKIRYVNNIKSVGEMLKKLFPSADIKLFEKDMLYQIEMTEGDHKTYFKVVFSQSNYEFIITNTDKWTVNTNPKQWTKKTQPIFVENSEKFTNLLSTSDKVSKIVLIYPTCKKVIRYLNESDTVIIKPEDNYKGISFIRYDELEEFLLKR